MSVPRLVLLPGLDGTGTLFEPFVDALKSAAPVTVVSYSPESASYGDCRLEAERSLPRNEPYLLVGESFSGPVAVSIAARRPSGLCGLVLAGSFITSPSRLLTGLSRFTSVMPVRGPSWAVELMLLGRHATPERRLLLRQALACIEPRVLRQRLKQVAHMNVTRELSAIQVPILCLRAREDRLVPARCADEIARVGHGVSVVEVSAPHMVLQCAPAETAGLILSFARASGAVRA